MFESIIWQDIAISIGGFIGIITKIYALQDTKTVWSRKSSLINVVFYPPSLIAFYTLNLWLTFATTTLSFLTWLGVYLFRSPKSEDWLGRSCGK